MSIDEEQYNVNMKILKVKTYYVFKRSIAIEMKVLSRNIDYFVGDPHVTHHSLWWMWDIIVLVSGDGKCIL